MKSYFYRLVHQYLSLYILPNNSVIEIDPRSPLLIRSFPQGKVSFRPHAQDALIQSQFSQEEILPFDEIKERHPNYLLLSGIIHEERDIQALLGSIHGLCESQTRLILTYYSSLWRPFANLASRLGLRSKQPEANWLAHEDIENLLGLEEFELIRLDHKILLPIYIPLLSTFINRYLAPLPLVKHLCLLNIALARPRISPANLVPPSVSIIVPARNEAGNIKAIIERIPVMGPHDEIIFIEGNSTDDTWSTIQSVQKQYGLTKNIVFDQQAGKGKGDAVRKGFSLAKNEILMILDADMTVPPEDLPKFYQAIKNNRGEFINGTRLVYPMEKEAMRFINLLGNKFFALAFSFVLGQRFKDTLCGTKVISRTNYSQLAANRSYFGEFDPFGDFDLIFGAARMGLKIVEVPITYRERTYGETNISRWRHGAILLAMLFFSARKIKFL